MTSHAHDDFGWPRVVPVLERPALPPLKTGIRVFCPKTHADHCKQDDYQDYDEQLDSCKPAKFDIDDDDVLMSRQKFMLLNESLTCKPVTPADKNKLKTTFQVAYGNDDSTYDKIKNRLLVPIDENAHQQCCLKKMFYDPFPFKNSNDKAPLLG